MIDPLEPHSIDKSGWGDGPWQAEPDYELWIDLASGFPCYARRSPTFGCWCGYLGLPPQHPWFRLAQEDIPIQSVRGLSASGYAPIERGTKPVYRWLGFHCGEAGDYYPAVWRGLPQPDYPHADRGDYRDIDFVKTEITSMALQASALDEWQEIRLRLIAEGVFVGVGDAPSR